MERPDSERRREAAVTWTLLVLVFALGAAAFALVAGVYYTIPPQVPAWNAAGIKALPPGMRILIQISNFITTKWYLVIPPYGMVLALLLSRLNKR